MLSQVNELKVVLAICQDTLRDQRLLKQCLQFPKLCSRKFLLEYNNLYMELAILAALRELHVVFNDILATVGVNKIILVGM